MPILRKIHSVLMISSFLFCLGMSSNAIASNFLNPFFKTPEVGCRADNLRLERFTPEINLEQRVKVCRAIDQITIKLNTNVWSPTLLNELTSIWEVFSNESITVKLMPTEASSRILAMAEPLSGVELGDKFGANIYLRPNKINYVSFFQILLHELRHVFDFYQTWKNKTFLNYLDLERRAFLLMSKLSEESPDRVWISTLPVFWKDNWSKLPISESSMKRQTAIENYLQSNKIYRDFGNNGNKQTLDFTYLKTGAKSAQKDYSFSKTSSERLPNRQLLPETTSLIPQNVKDIDFKLEKPMNLRDEKEILRIALHNEIKLYYSMNNFVYDQKLAFQCWNKGKIVAEFVEKDTIARTMTGNTLKTDFSKLPNPLPCLSNYQNLKTDFTETFWASPALEKMPISFVGFVNIDGQTLARYTVLQPDARLFKQLADQYSYIKPFRVFVGTIFVSPQDGQIVKFWGSSFPDDKITNNAPQKVFGSYLVTALRQKLNVNNSVWVTVYIATTAAINIDNELRPFSYTVNFENYRQSATDVRILDDNETSTTVLK